MADKTALGKIGAMLLAATFCVVLIGGVVVQRHLAVAVDAEQAQAFEMARLPAAEVTPAGYRAISNTTGAR